MSEKTAGFLDLAGKIDWLRLVALLKDIYDLVKEKGPDVVRASAPGCCDHEGCLVESLKYQLAGVEATASHLAHCHEGDEA